jgi:hypothetical protein
MGCELLHKGGSTHAAVVHQPSNSAGFLYAAVEAAMSDCVSSACTVTRFSGYCSVSVAYKKQHLTHAAPKGFSPNAACCVKMNSEKTTGDHHEREGRDRGGRKIAWHVP